MTKELLQEKILSLICIFEAYSGEKVKSIDIFTATSTSSSGEVIFDDARALKVRLIPRKNKNVTI